MTEAGRWLTAYDVVVVGLGALGSAAAMHLARRGQRVLGLERFELGHKRGASPRHQPDPAAQLPHAGLRAADPGGVRRLGATSSAGRASSWSPSSAASTCSRPTRRSRWTTTRRRSTTSASRYELLDVAEIGRRWPQFSLPAGTVGLYQDRGAIVPAGRGTALMQKLAAAAGRRAARLDAGAVGGRRRRRASRCRRTPRRSSPTGSSCAPTPGPTRCSPASTSASPWRPRWSRRRTSPPSAPAASRPHHLPLWIWMDDPSYYGFPCYGEPTVKAAQDCGGPVIDTSDPDVADLRAGPGDAGAARVVHGVGAAGVRAAGPLDPLPVHPHARPRLRPRARARPRVGRRRPRRGARLQVRADLRAAAGRARRPRARRPPTSRRTGSTVPP